MPCWYFDKAELKNTPSFRDGVDSEKETRYRREGARLIMDCGNQMNLRYDTMATGVVFFHRFYMFHSFNEFPRYAMAACCLFLAGKVEETPKKCKDIVKAAKAWLESKSLEKYMASLGEDPIKDMMIYEKILLQTIKFDLQVDHPYGYLLKYAKTLKGDPEQIRDMVQMAWTFINDSYCTTLCLQWEPEIIAIALMYLTGKVTSKHEIKDWVSKKDNSKQNWWEQFVEGLELEVLDDICHQFLDLYSNQQQLALKFAGHNTSSPNQEQNAANNAASNDSQNGNSQQNLAAKRKNTPPNPTSPKSTKRLSQGDVYTNSQQQMTTTTNPYTGNGLLPPPTMPPLANAPGYPSMFSMAPPPTAASMLSMNGGYAAANTHAPPPGAALGSAAGMPPQQQHHHLGMYAPVGQSMPPPPPPSSAPPGLAINSHYGMYQQLQSPASAPPPPPPHSGLMGSHHMHPGAMMPAVSSYPPPSVQPGLFPTPPPSQAPPTTVSTPTTPTPNTAATAYAYPPLYSSNPPPGPYDYAAAAAAAYPMYNNGMPGLAGAAPMSMPGGGYNNGNGLEKTSILGIDAPRGPSKPMYVPPPNQVRPSALKSVNITNRTS